MDGGVASAAAADMAVTTADTPAATAAAVAAEDGEAAVDVARLGRARALLVAGAKFSGTIDIPGIHDGVDEESLYEARCATHHIPPPTHTPQRSAKSYTATPALQEPSCMLYHYYFTRLYCVPPLLKKQKNSPAPAPPLSRTDPDPLVCARTTHFILWISGPTKTTRRRFTSCTIYFCLFHIRILYFTPLLFLERERDQILPPGALMKLTLVRLHVLLLFKKMNRYTLEVSSTDLKDALGLPVVLAQHAAYGDTQTCHLKMGTWKTLSHRHIIICVIR